jgi:hypothetical protein
MHSFPGEDDRETDGSQGPDSSRRYKAVVNYLNGDVLKGYLETTRDLDMSAALLLEPGRQGPVFSVREPGTDQSREVRLTDIKSLYLVKSFKGDSTKRDLHFYRNGPDVGSVWVEVRFTDREVVEGLVDNSIQHLTGKGFLLRPSDPGANNLAIYINKAAIASYRVLGVRATTH